MTDAMNPTPEMGHLVTGMGLVAILAPQLEWALGYLTHAMRGQDDAEFAAMMARPGTVWREFDTLCKELQPLLGADVEGLRAEVAALRDERNRVMHSIWLLGADSAGLSIYEKWHPRSDTTYPVTTEEVFALGCRITDAIHEAQALAVALIERGELELASYQPQVPPDRRL